ncbi:MAG: hypothetical protein HRT68_14790, partial [Flavobacteriaceae bacterium]|nr:hypothetical protein [Flavobacteriaceae bacterium]
MKFKILLIIIVLAFISCVNKTTRLHYSTLKIITNKPSEELKLYKPIDGIVLWDEKKVNLTLDSIGHYSYNFELENPEIIGVQIGNNKFPMIIELDKTYEIKVLQGLPEFSGDNHEGNKLYGKLPWKSYESTQRAYEIETAKELSIFKDSLAQSAIHEFEILEKEGKISPFFLTSAENFISHFYAEFFLNFILQKQRGPAPISEGFKSMKKNILKENPVDSKTYSPMWGEYLNAAILYNKSSELVEDGEITEEEINHMGATGDINDLYYSFINESISDPEVKEKYL